MRSRRKGGWSWRTEAIRWMDLGVKKEEEVPATKSSSRWRASRRRMRENFREEGIAAGRIDRQPSSAKVSFKIRRSPFPLPLQTSASSNQVSHSHPTLLSARQ